MTLSCQENYLVIDLYNNNVNETQVNAGEFKFLMWDCVMLHTNIQVAQSSEQAPVTSEVVGSFPTSDL